MRRTRRWVVPAVLLSITAWFAAPSLAQVQELKIAPVQLGDNVSGILYEPVTPTAKSQVAVYVMHIGSDYTHFSACTELSKRGYRVLCARNSVGGAANKDGIDRKLLDAKLGVEYLRKYAGVRKVVLFGHSGGGMLMSAYQNIAENGVKACQGPEKILKCSDSLAGLPRADGVMLLDAHYGDAVVNLLLGMSPSMASGSELSADLDPYNPKNGYDPNGAKYSDEFLRRYQTQVGKKMNQLIQDARARLAAGDAANNSSHETELFSIPGAAGARLWSLDPRLLSHTHNAWPLLRPDGSTVTQVVYSVRPTGGQPLPGGAGPGVGAPRGGPPNAPPSPGGPPNAERGQRGGFGGQSFTVKEFLNTYAIRVTDDFGYGEDGVRGIDWSSNYACAPGNVKGITVPLLTMGMTGSYEYLSAEMIYQNAGSGDKSIAFVEGASHGFTTCARCERTPGQFGDTQKTLYDFLDKWLGEKGRF